MSLYCFGAALLLSDRRGIKGALDPRAIWRTARANRAASVGMAITYLACTLVVVAITVPIGFVVPFGGGGGGGPAGGLRRFGAGADRHRGQPAGRRLMVDR